MRIARRRVWDPRYWTGGRETIWFKGVALLSVILQGEVVDSSSRDFTELTRAEF